MTRISKHPDERRNELIASARRLFFSKGYEKTSINDIVKDVGVAKGLFYYYFDSKTAILEALVEQTSQEGIAIMHAIIVNDSLSALEKWARSLDATNSWKLARRAEMLSMLRILASDDNLLLRYKLTQRSTEMLAPEFAKIIEQGNAEGVFDVEHLEDSAEIILAIINSARNLVFDVMLDPTAYADPVQIVKQKMLAIQDAVERVLGAEPNTLPLLITDESVLQDWFSQPIEPEKIR